MSRVIKLKDNILNKIDNLSSKQKTLLYILLYTLLFSVTFLIAYNAFFEENKTFVWQADGRNQHFPTLIYIGKYLRALIANFLGGNFVLPQVDLNLVLGGDIITTLNYYGFGDPLNLLSAIVPAKHTEILYKLLIVFRMYLSGLAFSALCFHNKKPKLHTLVGAVIFVFSGFALVSGVRHPYFINPLIQLPLLVLGIDLILEHKKPFVFILTVAYSALCGFYFFYMMTIMIFAYAVIKFFCTCKANKLKEFFAMFVKSTVYYLMGICISASIFLPNVIGFFTCSRYGSSFDFNYFDYGEDYYWSVMLRCISPTGAWEALALAAIILFAAAIMLIGKKKKYLHLKLLFILCLIVYILPIGGYIFNGFGYPSQRWTFGFDLLLAYTVVETLPELVNLSGKKQALCLAILLLYSLLIFNRPQNRNTYYLMGIVMLSLTLIALMFISRITPDNHKNLSAAQSNRIKSIVCIILVVFNVTINASYVFSPYQYNYISEFKENGFETNRIDKSLENTARKEITENDGRFDSSSFYRNVGAVVELPTTYSYWSLINSHCADYWRETQNIGLYIFDMLFGTDERTITDTLLSTKYFIDKNKRSDYVPYGYSEIKKGKGYTIYENQNALPWGYTYDSFITEDEFNKLNPIEKEEAMLQTIVLQNSVDGVKKGNPSSNLIPLSYQISETQNLQWENNKLEASKDNASITLDVQIPPNTEAYLMADGLRADPSTSAALDMKVKCDDVTKTISVLSPKNNWYSGKEDYTVNLCYSTEERSSIKLIVPKKGSYSLNNIQLYALPFDNYSEQVNALKSEPLENVNFATNHFDGTINLSKEKILCVSIPYSNGWTATVDGKKAEILCGNKMFMALKLDKGQHKIEFNYETPGLKAGALLLLIPVFAFIGYILINRKRPKRTTRYKK